MFKETVRETIDRIRRATHGKTDVLFLTTVPGAERWTTYAELSDAVRAAAAERKAGLGDPEKAFHAAGGSDKRESLYCTDKTHLGPTGHEIFANTVLSAIEAGR
jgi:lysophospholipase L1-like esterase